MARPHLSFEFFPPHSPAANMRLWSSVERLAPLGPDFVSVTYGAGGTTRDRTRAAIATIKERARLQVAAHLTCVDATRSETLDVARGFRRMGVKRIVALRGDPPKGADRFVAHPDGYGSAAELVEGLMRDGDYDITVAAYPEVHPEAASVSADIDNLKRKFDAGAQRAICQFCFETDTFLRFRDACADAGIAQPILPGILPVENFAKMQGFAARCGAGIPEWMKAAFGNAQTEAEAKLLAVAIAAEQATDMMEAGVDHLHFYTLNDPDLTWDICAALGLEANDMQAVAGGAA
ncbi:methylenetetrahydrofolate reductase [NAD(P)H] [Pontivivens insulae]|uniref:Methylenetetrahydrofolate reductase n=1 Tax=Pontivivens insulae TaxID=1639689 RepID=A0A2R8ACC7_9RHOB|nr:methylenetetrahydrofolate reductase [NAD(P)H] [Pontivivens insulae]RED11105.1 5,10-methylenetetrahydrofolate reductase (NAD(P)) [Pontivivens insulae]SPF29720.1 5,10-methylenetetrahydrofolate reductase [Pontivivens insulae]